MNDEKTRASAYRLTKAGKKSLLRRVASSSTFSSSPALQAFLTFIVEQEIAGSVDEIKEQRIGSEVLGRRSNYNPAEDNIVRVRAHELRERLARYFETAGAHEPVEIVIPRGGYVPIFRERSSAPPETPAEHSSRVSPPPLKSNWTPAQATAVRDFWTQFLDDPGRELRIVVADAAFALWQDLTGQNVNLGDYLSRRYLDLGDPLLREVATRRCTAPADLNITLQLVELAGALGGTVRAQYARSVSMAEIRTGCTILLGSRRSNPWVQLFESRMNFILGLDPSSGAPRFENQVPRSDEPQTFGIPWRLDIEGTERTEMESYALVALVPDLSGRGRVLILEGLSMEATEAAGETVANVEKLTALLQQIGHVPQTPVQPFEALIRVTTMPGGYVNPRLTAFRYPLDSCDS